MRIHTVRNYVRFHPVCNETFMTAVAKRFRGACVFMPAMCHPPQAMDNMMPGFDREIAKLAQRVLINPRSIDFHTGVLASKVIPGPQHWRKHLCTRDFACCVHQWRSCR